MRKQRMWLQKWVHILVALFSWIILPSLHPAIADDAISTGKFAPDASRLKSPGKMAVNRSGSIFVVDAYKNRVQKFDNHGELQDTIKISRPSAVAAASDGPVYIGSHDTYSVAIVKNSEVTGYLGDAKNEFLSISDIAVDTGEGDVYVVDTRANAVKVYTAAGAVKGKMGGFTAPVAVAVTAGEVIVLDAPLVPCPTTIMVKGTLVPCPECTGMCSGSRLTVLDKNGTPVRSTTESQAQNGNMIRPTGLAADSHGNIYVSDTIRKAILVYDRNLSFVGDMESGQDDLHQPLSLTLSGDDSLYVSEGGARSIVEIGIAGRLHTAPTGSLTFKSGSGAAVSRGVLGY